MSPDLTPWAIIAGFMVGLVAAVLDVIRRIVTGRLTPRVTHEDVMRQRDKWQAAAQTALATNAEIASQMSRIVATVEQQAVTQRDTLDLVRQLVRSRSADGQAP